MSLRQTAHSGCFVPDSFLLHQKYYNLHHPPSFGFERQKMHMITTADGSRLITCIYLQLSIKWWCLGWLQLQSWRYMNHQVAPPACIGHVFAVLDQRACCQEAACITAEQSHVWADGPLRYISVSRGLFLLVSVRMNASQCEAKSVATHISASRMSGTSSCASPSSCWPQFVLVGPSVILSPTFCQMYFVF